MREEREGAKKKNIHTKYNHISKYSIYIYIYKQEQEYIKYISKNIGIGDQVEEHRDGLHGRRGHARDDAQNRPRVPRLVSQGGVFGGRGLRERGNGRSPGAARGLPKGAAHVRRKRRKLDGLAVLLGQQLQGHAKPPRDPQSPMRSG